MTGDNNETGAGDTGNSSASIGGNLTIPTAIAFERKELKRMASRVLAFKKMLQDGMIALPDMADVPEMIANATIAYRALEDASMRMGKVQQAYDGGVSVYDREQVVGA